MKVLNTSLSLGLSVLLLSSLNAFAESKTETTNEVTNSMGTKIKVEESASHTVDSDGNTKIESDHTRVKDPKGLMNKTKEQIHAESEIKANGERHDKTKSVDAHGTAKDYSASVTKDDHMDGSSTTTVESKEVVDPKGLMNKKSVEIKEEIDKNADGSLNGKKITKSVDGKVVSETDTTK